MYESHSTRVRGLKSLAHPKHWPKQNVALYTSAWIEISLRQKYFHRTFRRTLHECVDWNINPLLNPSGKHLSHSTRVRGLKYWRNKRWTKTSKVALYTSAWIEMVCQHVGRYPLDGRTLHECVDWNINTTPMWEPLFGRTLHECVDWNLIEAFDIWQNYRSHSTRVRGLKFSLCKWPNSCSVSHSTRVRGLKFLLISWTLL